MQFIRLAHIARIGVKPQSLRTYFRSPLSTKKTGEKQKEAGASWNIWHVLLTISVDRCYYRPICLLNLTFRKRPSPYRLFNTRNRTIRTLEISPGCPLGSVTSVTCVVNWLLISFSISQPFEYARLRYQLRPHLIYIKGAALSKNLNTLDTARVSLVNDSSPLLPIPLNKGIFGSTCIRSIRNIYGSFIVWLHLALLLYRSICIISRPYYSPRLYRVYLNLVARILDRTPIFTQEIAIRMAEKHVNDGEEKIQDNPAAKLPANHLQNHLHAVQWAHQYGLSSWNKSSQARTKLYIMATVEFWFIFSYKMTLWCILITP